MATPHVSILDLPGTDARYRLSHIGPSLSHARGVIVAIHGRGATAQGILPLAEALRPHSPDEEAEGWALIAPQAPGGSWYPYSFMAPFEANAPHFEQAIEALSKLEAALIEAGLTPDRQLWTGFSQGACLTLEYTTRHPKARRGVAAFSGGLIGPEGTTWPYPAELAGTPVYMGCDDRDPHIPASRFTLTADELRKKGARLEARLFTGMGHTITETELTAAHAHIWG